jgi:2-polyprenyl-3-methyl-5-hydroxy-6-metoxy-1,4-benzoquinol methylase
MTDMTFLDRRLQDLRILAARRWLRRGDRVLDVGCADGTLFQRLPWLQGGTGIDPMAEGNLLVGSHRIVRGNFPDDVEGTDRFDAIVALAVFEHVPEGEGGRFADACRHHLRPGGRVVMTVPAPVVDRILHFLMRLHVIAGMEVHQHWGLQPSDIPGIFEGQGLQLVHHRRFELGVNHLFVFARPEPG